MTVIRLLMRILGFDAETNRLHALLRECRAELRGPNEGEWVDHVCDHAQAEYRARLVDDIDHALRDQFAGREGP